VPSASAATTKASRSRRRALALAGAAAALLLPSAGEAQIPRRAAPAGASCQPATCGSGGASCSDSGCGGTGCSGPASGDGPSAFIVYGGVSTVPGATGLSLGMATGLRIGGGPELLVDGVMQLAMAGDSPSPLTFALTGRLALLREGLDRPWEEGARAPQLGWLAGLRVGVQTSPLATDLLLGAAVEFSVGRLLWVAFRPAVTVRGLPATRSELLPIAVGPVFDLVVGWLPTPTDR
jgi:hypothetical protein